MMDFVIPETEVQVTLEEYTPKSLVLRSKPDPKYLNRFYDYLTKSGFKRNPRLKIGYGWVLSKKSQEKGVEALEKIKSGEVQPKTPEEVEKARKNAIERKRGAPGLDQSITTFLKRHFPKIYREGDSFVIKREGSELSVSVMKPDQSDQAKIQASYSL